MPLRAVHPLPPFGGGGFFYPHKTKQGEKKNGRNLTPFGCGDKSQSS
jgi:hypothetical protein